MRRIFLRVIIIFCTWYHVGCHDQCPCKCPETDTTQEKIKDADKAKPLDKELPAADSKKSFHNIRLPMDVKPTHYDIFLDVNMKTKQVEGNVTIKVRILQPTKYILIHAFGFETLKGRILDKKSKVISVEKQFSYTENQYYVLQVKEDLPLGSYFLQYNYSYELKKSLAGFYQASYKTKSGSLSTGAFTQFQPTDARQAFPCFDEPALRASFNITLGHEKEFIAISNMPIIKTWYDKKRRYDEFSKSPLMPVYLLAFAICQFGKITVIAKTRTPVKMTFYAPHDQISMIEYAVNAGSKILPFFEEYYNVPYPLPKADMMAVPDFAAGAMENWGLVTYRLRALLYDEVMSPLSSKLNIALYISHELAHMWFGNLVTMEWWSDLWLNEGFATYVEYLGVNAIHPEWKYEEFHIINDMATALRLDALLSSHPIYHEVNHPDQINEMFDSISYSKGSCLVRMVDNFMGTKNFVTGINAYLRRYSFGNARTEDLWEELSKVSRVVGDNYNVSHIMNTWVLQMGFPVIDVTRTDDGSFKLSQSRFLSNKKADFSNVEIKSPYGYKWIIPFNYYTINTKDISNVAKGAVKKLWLNMTGASIKMKSDDFIIKGNAGQYGFFRVNYDKYGWQKIISILKDNHLVFEVKDRVGLLQDAFALTTSGRLDGAIALDLFDYIHKETDYLPWGAAYGSVISYTSARLSQNKAAKNLWQKYIRMKVSKLYKKYEFGYFSEFRERKLQLLIVKLACHNGHKGCLKRTSEMFEKWMNGEAIPTDFQSLVLYFGVHNGGEKEWKFAFDQYLSTNIPSLKSILLYAICATKEPRLIDRLLHYSSNETIFKSQDVHYVFRYIARTTSHGRYHAWYFLRENWRPLVNRYAAQWSTMKYIVSGIVQGFTTEYSWKQVIEFFNKDRMKGIGQVNRTLAQSLEKIKENIEWLKNHETFMENWLKLKVQGVGPK